MWKKIWSSKLWWLVILIGMGVGGYFVYQKYYSKTDQTSYVLAAAEKGTIITSVSGTGQVAATSELEVKTKVAGEILQIIEKGKEVKTGEVLAQFDNQDAVKSVNDAQISLENAQISLEKLKLNNAEKEKTVRDAEINLESAKLSLEKVKQGASDQEIQTAQLKISQAKTNLENAKKDLERTKSQAQISIAQIYDDFLSLATDSIEQSLSSMISLTRIQYEHFNGNDQTGYNIASYKAEALKLLLGLDDAGRANVESINQAYGGLKQKVAENTDSSDHEKVDQLANEVATALQAVKSTLSVVPYNTELTDSEVSNIEQEKNNINNQIANISAKKLSIESEYFNNQSSLTSAQTKIEDAETSVINAENDLITLQEAADPLDIKAQELSIKQKENALADAKADLNSQSDQLDIKTQQLSIKQKENDLAEANKKLSDYTLTAPSDGVITEVALLKGDNATANATIVTLMSKQKVAEISLNEVDVSKIEIGQKATLTFDALTDLSVTGKVVEVDLVGTVEQGVVSYNAKIAFDTEEPTVKSGMSVSASIITDVKQDILLVPNAGVKSSNGSSYVEILETDQTANATTTGIVSTIAPNQKTVTTGLSDDTSTEILSGLDVGQMIVIKTNTISSQSSTTTGNSLFQFGPGNNRNTTSSSTSTKTTGTTSSTKSNTSTSAAGSGPMDAGGAPPF
ncbi:MAG: efflux RND transporter periplasmic adaptor subunit [Patescibacteria group bacterium]